MTDKQLDLFIESKKIDVKIDALRQLNNRLSQVQAVTLFKMLEAQKNLMNNSFSTISNDRFLENKVSYDVLVEVREIIADEIKGYENDINDLIQKFKELGK